MLQNQGQSEKSFGHFDSPDLPMEFICMDLVGPIHPPSSRGNKYVLTVIDMLTGFTIAVPIKNKNAETITLTETISIVFLAEVAGCSLIMDLSLKIKKCKKFVTLLV